MKISIKLKNILLMFSSTIFGLIICEIVLRIFFPQIEWSQRKDISLGWSNREYQQFDPHTRKLKTRILFLGDSILAGSGLSSLSQRFPVLLDKKLGDNVEIKIIASAGWGTDQQLLAFLQKGKDWNPDIVVLAFCANNDISNNLSHHHGPKMLKPYFVLEKDRLILYDAYGRPYNIAELPFQGSSWTRSYLLDFIRLGIRRLSDKKLKKNFSRVPERYTKLDFWQIEEKKEIYRQSKTLSWSPQLGVNDLSAYVHEDFEINTYQWKLLKHILAALNKEVTDIKGKLIVMLMPIIFNSQDLRTVAGGEFRFKFKTPKGEFTFRSAEPRDRLSKICKELDIIFFNPIPGFIETIRKNKLMKEVWPTSNRHFSSVGHEILANMTYSYLVHFLNIKE